MQRIATKTPAMNSKSLTAASYWPHAENASPMLLFRVLARAADRDEYRQAAGATNSPLRPPFLLLSGLQRMAVGQSRSRASGHAPVISDFCNKIGHKRTHALQQTAARKACLCRPLVASFKLIFSVSAALVRSKNRLPNSQNSRCR
jgi:hypothetical protein